MATGPLHQLTALLEHQRRAELAIDPSLPSEGAVRPDGEAALPLPGRSRWRRLKALWLQGRRSRRWAGVPWAPRVKRSPAAGV